MSLDLPILGEGHGTQINGLRRSKGSKLASVGIDDSMRIFDQNTSTYEAGNATKLKAQPRGIDHKGDLTVVVTRNSIVMVMSFFEI